MESNDDKFHQKRGNLRGLAVVEAVRVELEEEERKGSLSLVFATFFLNPVRK